MRYQLLIGFMFLNMITSQAMEERGNYSHNQISVPLRAVLVVMPTIIIGHTNLVQDNQSKQRHVFYDQPDKKRFNKIVYDTKPKKGYASEKRLLAPRNKIRSK